MRADIERFRDNDLRQEADEAVAGVTNPSQTFLDHAAFGEAALDVANPGQKASGHAAFGETAPNVSTIKLVDMHCHLAFTADPAFVAAMAERRGIGLFSATVTPDEYDTSTAALRDNQNVKVGLGLHPWFISDGTCGEKSISAFEERAATCRYISEAGLDFGKTHGRSRDMQADLFQRILKCCLMGGKVMSLHAVKSDGAVLDLLDAFETTRNNVCIFHSFMGSSDDLHRAIKTGCYFSVGRRMLASRRGREYVKAIPSGKILLETDEPSFKNSEFSIEVHEEHLVSTLQDIENIEGRPIADEILDTSKHLLSWK